MFEALYRSVPGRMLARVIAVPFVSRSVGHLMDSRFSALFIRNFIRKNNIDMSEVAEQKFGSFNAFFTRRLKDGARPLQDGFVSPCDGLLSVYDITENSVVPIKGYEYGIKELLGDRVDGCPLYDVSEFCGGTCLVFRLTPAHYHRYIRPCDGRVLGRGFIPGIFHTVRPLALQKVPVFKTNTRAFDCVESAFGRFIQMEVGATMVGRIVNNDAEEFKKGDEKGRFEFGGSTIILILPKDTIRLNPEFIRDTEVPVKLGWKLNV